MKKTGLNGYVYDFSADYDVKAGVEVVNDQWCGTASLK